MRRLHGKVNILNQIIICLTFHNSDFVFRKAGKPIYSHEEVSQLKQVPENSIYANHSPIGVRA